jgi:hypothetical protein
VFSLTKDMMYCEHEHEYVFSYICRIDDIMGYSIMMLGILVRSSCMLLAGSLELDSG